MTRRLSLAFLLAALQLQPASAAPAWHGVAAQHRSLARVANQRGMDARGILFASPLVPIGTRLCVRSGIHPQWICGVVVDVPQPDHYEWQMRERRYVEVDPRIARLLCVDPTGLPSSCPVEVST